MTPRTHQKIMLASSCGLCSIKINPLIPKRLSIFNRSESPSISNLQPPENDNRLPTRRNFTHISILSLVVSPVAPSWAESDELLELERYTDMNQGFTLLRPKSWIKVEKAGATLLFEDPNKGSNNVGVVVTPVRLTGLEQFGDPQFVANKLIQAEKRKESTKDVELVTFLERRSKNGELQVYEFEYDVDSTRGGLKTIFSAAFVASNKLYLLNIAHSPNLSLSNNKRKMLEKVLHSFDLYSSNSY
ncbi:hypothetical protein R6Q57_011366 [Mikania cordata]